MTIDEMIEELKDVKRDVGGDVEVHIAYSYGDYWHNIVAPNATRVESDQIVWSEYHRMHRLLSEDEKDSYLDGLNDDADVDRKAAEDLSTERGKRIAEKTPRQVVVIR